MKKRTKKMKMEMENGNEILQQLTLPKTSSTSTAFVRECR